MLTKEPITAKNTAQQWDRYLVP